MPSCRTGRGCGAAAAAPPPMPLRPQAAAAAARPPPVLFCAGGGAPTPAPAPSPAAAAAGFVRFLRSSGAAAPSESSEEITMTSSATDWLPREPAAAPRVGDSPQGCTVS